MSVEVLFNGVGEIALDSCESRKTLVEGTGAGNDYIGWVNLPVNYDKEEFARIREAAERIRGNSKVLVVCGVGGSYLGPEAAIDFLKGKLSNLKAAALGKDELQIYFTGNNLTPGYINDIVEMIGDKDFSVNVISKSGGTMETAVAFRIFRKLLEEKYGKEEAAKRIYATTSRNTGLLKAEAEKEGYETFIIPDDVGGRYSVFSPVGLLPLAAAGCDIDALMQGAKDMWEELQKPGKNAAMEYAEARQQLYRNGKKIEIFASYDPDLSEINEWLKQLFGESEGKDGKGIFPAGVSLTNDLHSMGQMIQEGERTIFETVIRVKDQYQGLTVPAFETDFDKLGYMEGKPVAIMNDAAVQGVMDAHLSGGVPQIRITIPKKDEHSLGELFYFFEYACGVSAYISGVNPFNQPGVEAYKKNIKVILAEQK